MVLIENILAAIVVLGGLVTFHELGHYWVARWCGVHVVAFSFGFGKPLLSWHDRRGTRFMISMLPLGGYVRLLEHPNELDDPATQHGTPMAAQSCGRRALIMAAGPAANFILALLLYWALFMHGITGITPVIGAVEADGWAAKGGLVVEQQIARVNGQETSSWQQVQQQLQKTMPGQAVTIDTTDGQHHDLAPLPDEDERAAFWQQMGVVPWQPPIAPVIGAVMPDSAAQEAGLVAGMRILAVNGVAVTQWQTLLTQIRHTVRPHGLTLEVQWPDDTSASRQIEVFPRWAGEGAAAVAVLGIQPRHGAVWPASHLYRQHYSVTAAFEQGARQLVKMTQVTLNGMWQLATGAVSPRNLGGPVMIAQVAGESARNGVEASLGFMAYLSISLGLFNLLPIPMLDGGQLIYLFAEALKGRPLSPRLQLGGRLIGLGLVGGLMCLALYFDLTRV